MLLSGFRNKWIMALLFIPVISLGQIKVSHVSDSLAIDNKNGLLYNLPRTRLVFEIVLTKTTKEKGPFSEYARDFLGLENIINRNSVEYKIIDIQVSTISESDPDQYYFVEKICKFPWIYNRKASLQTTPEGFLISYNQFIKPTVPINTIKKSRYYGNKYDTGNLKDESIPFYHINDALISREDNKPKVDSTIRLPLRHPVYKIETKDMPVIEKARMTLINLATIRENRQNLASGYQEVAYENGTMKLMLNQLNIQEKELLQQFTGISHEETIKFCLSYLPVNQDTNIFPIAWINRQNGVSSKPTDEALPISVQLKTILPVSDKGVVKKSKKVPQGIVYRVPFTAECNITVGNELIYSGQQIISQFGSTMRLPKQARKALFFPETGGLNCTK